NALAGHDAAIVTEIAGTTRDVLRERIQIDGMPLHIIDTAGLRESTNIVEQEGIRRAHEEIRKADKILLLIDIQDDDAAKLMPTLPTNVDITKVYNKIDLQNRAPEIKTSETGTEIYLSIKTGAGINLLTEHLKQSVGYNDNTENIFIARTRHLQALMQGRAFIENALHQLQTNLASELVAEDLRLAHQALSEITGEFTSDDLLGKIFSSFCIGK
ncbi:partial tRNA modification GTPase MnmE, partial [biofilm metagenome]